jgi:hypothetical protein
VLTEEQRQAWIAAAAKVESHPRLWQSGSLIGEMHFQGIGSARACIDREILLWPPERVVFRPNPVEGLAIICVNGQIRLRLKVSRPVAEDIMVFWQAPCSAGRKKWRHGAYLGLLPAPVGCESDITDMYVAKYGEPKPGDRVFIRTRQQVNGWEGRNTDTSAVMAVKPVTAEQSKSGVPPVQAAEHERWQAGRPPCYAAQAWGGMHTPDSPDPRRIRFASPAPSVRCAMHKGVVPKQYRSASQATPVQCGWDTGCPRGVFAVGPGSRRCTLAEVRRKGHWRELWHGS